MAGSATSTSGSDDDSSSASSAAEERSSNGTNLPRGGTSPEPASSSSSSSSSSDQDGDGSDYEEEYGARQVSKFDDLPTDESDDEGDSDSEDEDDDSEKSSEDEASSSDGEGQASGGGDDSDPEDDAPLAERVASRALAGRRYRAGDAASAEDKGGGRSHLAERKSRALKLAAERLREARRGRGAGAKGGGRERSNGEEDDGRSADDSSDKSEKDGRDRREDGGGSKKGKRSRHAPTEMSSRRRDYFARGGPDLNASGIGVSIGANRYRARDPRMLSLSGRLDAETFERRYGFLDEMQEREIERLKERVEAWKATGRKAQRRRGKLGMTRGGTSREEDGEELARLVQARAERRRAATLREAKRKVKRRAREDVASGRRGAYYPKRGELRRMEAEARYEEIRERGGEEAVNRAIAKRRKKDLAKAAKRMPSHMAA